MRWRKKMKRWPLRRVRASPATASPAMAAACRMPQAGVLLSELLALPGLDPGIHLALLREAARGSPRVSAEGLAAGFERQLQAGRFDALHPLLRELPLDLHAALQPRLWFKLALADRGGGAGGDPRSTLRELIQRFPRAPEADKARVLLG